MDNKTKPLDPCLGPEGYVESPEVIAVKIFNRYFISHYSSSLTYPGSVASLAHDMQKSGNDPREIKDNVEASLLTIFSDTFEIAEVNVTVTSDEDNRLSIHAEIKYGKEGEVHDLVKKYNLGQQDDFLKFTKDYKEPKQ